MFKVFSLPKLFFSISLLLYCTVLIQSASPTGIFDDASSIDPLFTVKQEFGVVPWEYIWANSSGPLGRPASIAFIIFLIDGLDSGYSGIKTASVVLHFIATCMLVLLASKVSMRLHPAARAPLLAALLLWAVNPYWISTLLYAVQIMAMLAIFWVVVTYLLWWFAYEAYESGLLGKCFTLAVAGIVSLTLAVFSKENALIYMFPPAAWFLFFSFGSRPKLLWRLVIVITFAGLALGSAYWLVTAEVLTSYSHREFGLWERLLTQWYLIPTKTLELLTYSFDGPSIVHDNITIYRTLTWPDAAFPVLFWGSFCCMISLAIVSENVALRNLGFLCLCYLVAHLPESSVVPLELHFDHRYYGPAIFLYAACGFLVFNLLQVVQRRVSKCTLRKVTYPLGFMFIAVGLGKTVVFGTIWSSPILYASWEFENKPGSARANLLYAGVALGVGALDEAYELSHSANKIRVVETEWDYRIRNLYYACAAGGTYSEQWHRLPEPSDPVFYDNDSIQALWMKILRGGCDHALIEAWLLDNADAIAFTEGKTATLDAGVTNSVDLFLKEIRAESVYAIESSMKP